MDEISDLLLTDERLMSMCGFNAWPSRSVNLRFCYQFIQAKLSDSFLLRGCILLNMEQKTLRIDLTEW